MDDPDINKHSLFALKNILVASAKVKELSKNYKDLQIGAMSAIATQYALTCKPEDVLMANSSEHLAMYSIFDLLVFGEYKKLTKKLLESQKFIFPFNQEELNLLKQNPIDFIAFSYYMSGTVGTDVKKKEANIVSIGKNPYLKQNQWGWQEDPIGLRITLRKLYDRYQIPLFIAENGIGLEETLENNTVNDEQRISYLNSHLKNLLLAIEDGVEVIGYTWWGPIDLVSHSTGEMSKRYGFIYVDLDDEGNGTNKRYKKKSFDWIKEFISSKGANIK